MHVVPQIFSIPVEVVWQWSTSGPQVVIKWSLSGLLVVTKWCYILALTGLNASVYTGLDGLVGWI